MVRSMGSGEGRYRAARVAVRQTVVQRLCIYELVFVEAAADGVKSTFHSTSC